MSIHYDVLVLFKPFILGYCNCGCNTNINPWNFAGRFRKYKLGHNSRGETHPNWNGGRRKTKEGYIAIRSSNHPFCSNHYVFEHRLVMEKHLGRYLKPEEVVHHINGQKDDNRLINLELLENQSIHTRNHFKKDTSNRKCYHKDCKNEGKTYKNPTTGYESWHIYKNGWECLSCHRKKKKLIII